jgi:hypothetical protein
MNRQYEKVFTKVVHDWVAFFKKVDPTGGPVKAPQEASADAPPSADSEGNINSWIMTDHDPTIIYSNTGVRVLSDDNPDLPFEDRMELDFPGGPRRANRPGLVDAEQAINGMIRATNIFNKSYREWEAYTLTQIEKLGEELLDENGVTIHFDNRSSKLLIKIKEDPVERIRAFFQHNYLVRFVEGDFGHILRDIQAAQAKLLDDPNSVYRQYLDWKRDLALRQLRREIAERLQSKYSSSLHTRFH